MRGCGPRECLGGLVERSVTSEDLIAELDCLAELRGYPAVLRCDNGPELACAAMADWVGERVGLSLIPAGEPWRNCCSASSPPPTNAGPWASDRTGPSTNGAVSCPSTPPPPLSRPAPPSQQRRCHRRRVVPHARGQYQGRPAAKTLKPTARGGDFDLATSRDKELAVDSATHNPAPLIGVFMRSCA